MANEANIQLSLRINKGTLVYQSQPTAFTDDVTNQRGPTPGEILVSTGGTNVDLSQLSSPGWCFIMNMDDTDYVIGGIWEPDTSKFFPFFEVPPAKAVCFKLWRSLGTSYAGTGLTVDDTDQSLRLKAIGGACRVFVGAFER